MSIITIDGPFEPYKSTCTFCRHFNPVHLTCPAYPSGIAEDLLSGESKHDRIRSDQEGDLVFERG